MLTDDKKNGIITIKSFAGSDLTNYESFLKESFGQINENNVENLIIDIRDNPGGNTKYADQLINYFSDEPYQYERKLICKVSQERKYEINRLTENHSKEEKKDLLKLYNLNWLYDNPIGDTVVFKDKELLHYPKQVAHKFKGSVYLLINERCRVNSSFVCTSV